MTALLMLRSWKNNAFDTKARYGAKAMVDGWRRWAQRGRHHRRHIIPRPESRRSKDRYTSVPSAKDLRKSNSSRMERFVYYLERHIEVDTDNHDPMALEMVAAICGDNVIKWREAEETALSAMKSRVEFWDAVVEMIHEHRVGATG